MTVEPQWSRKLEMDAQEGLIWVSNQDGDEQQRVKGMLQGREGVGNVNNGNVGNDVNQKKDDDRGGLRQ